MTSLVLTDGSQLTSDSFEKLPDQIISLSQDSNLYLLVNNYRELSPNHALACSLASLAKPLTVLNTKECGLNGVSLLLLSRALASSYLSQGKEGRCQFSVCSVFSAKYRILPQLVPSM
uniref:Uncharacterized protein n=1 Tax=Timema monikensis TaxID=170555 RepID=A0A7R9EGD1_9NEOP|nr:unnamed protein product [Timema monikensis]